MESDMEVIDESLVEGGGGGRRLTGGGGTSGNGLLDPAVGVVREGECDGNALRETGRVRSGVRV